MEYPNPASCTHRNLAIIYLLVVEGTLTPRILDEDIVSRHLARIRPTNLANQSYITSNLQSSQRADLNKVSNWQIVAHIANLYMRYMRYAQLITRRFMDDVTVKCCLVYSPHPEPVSVSVLQRLNLHLPLSRPGLAHLVPVGPECPVQRLDNIPASQPLTQKTVPAACLVRSVPPSSAGGLQFTITLSWNTSVTLQLSGGVGLSGHSQTVTYGILALLSAHP